MGFLKSFCKAIGRGIGRKIEKFGEITNIHFIDMLGFSIKEACSETSSSIGSEDTFKSEEAGVEDATRINEALTEFTLSLEEKADIIEKNIIDEINAYLNVIVEELQGIENLDISTSRIIGTSKSAEYLIKGNIKKHISKRVSVDDYECAEILNMTSGTIKTLKMDLFAKNVLKEAIDLFKKDIQHLIDEQNSVLKSTIEGKIKDLKINVEKQILSLEEFENNQANDTELENLINKHNDIIEICDKCKEFLV